MSDTGRNKTVVTAISKISDRPVAKEACLVVIYGLELGKKFNLNRPQIIIGRSSKADIQIDQEAVSRNHCKIINTGNAIMLRDMGSTNGTYVNDEMIDEYVLRDGDFIKVGRCIFKFLSGNNIENAYHEEIYRLTTVDGLTQVFNRRYFVETLEREIGRALRYRRDLSLIMFDIDRFKGVNDSFGHLAGDHVLKHLASVIKTRIRREDVLARYGGEEFAIVLPEIDHYNAMQFAEKIRKLVEIAEFKFEDALIPVTVSIGVASLRGEIEDALEFIKQADTQLFAAKEGGPQRGEGLMGVHGAGSKSELQGGVGQETDSARELREKKRVLAALVVHDLRSPLSAIHGYLALLREELDEPTAQTRAAAFSYIDDATTLVNKALGLVATILDVDELEDGILKAVMAPVRIIELIERARAGNRAQFEVRDLRVDVDVDPDMVVRLDRDLFARIIENLIDNSARYAPRAGRVAVSVRRDAGGVEITIGNSGPPVPESERARIFGRYFQVEARRAAARANRGLGLYFCKLAAEAHGGSIHVEQRGDLGAVFVVRIPE